MRFLVTIPFVFTLAILASAVPTLTISQRQDKEMQDVADFASQLNGDIVQITQFFEDFPTLSGLALITQANAAFAAMGDATGTINSISLQLSNNAIVQTIKAELVDNDFLLDISLQFQDLAKVSPYDPPGDPFSETLGLYCSDAIPEINNLFQIVGSFVNNGIDITALPPNNCLS